MKTIEELLEVADTLVHGHTGLHLNDIQRAVLRESLQTTKKTYEQIADEYGYSPSYIKHGVAPQLWRLLSQGVGEKVTKTNACSVLERSIIYRNTFNNQLLTERWRQALESLPQSIPNSQAQALLESETSTIAQSGARVFLAYRHKEPAISLAQALGQALIDAGHILFLGTRQSIGQGNEWPKLLEKEYQQCDYLLLLLSQESLVSELVTEVIRQAIALRQTRREPKPVILIVRVQVPAKTPVTYPLQNYLNQLQQWEWYSSADTPIVSQEILNHLGKKPTAAIAQFPAALPTFSPVQSQQQLASDLVLNLGDQPLPSIEPELPDGSVPINSQFYIERGFQESKCYQEVNKPGALIRIKAPRQMGKTSLMNRILAHAETLEYSTAVLDFQQADPSVLTQLDKLLRWFCASLARQLNLEPKLDDYWDEDLGSKMNCTLYIQGYLLAQISSPIVLALEEVNEIFEKIEIAQAFLTLLRSWHEKAKNHPSWQKLRLLMVQSTEVYVPLNINQSPFNVGLEIALAPFTLEQVQDLAQRHGLNLPAKHIDSLMELVAGHPYLVRLALYHLARKELTLEELIKTAATNTGLYSDHLHRHLWYLQQNPELAAAFKLVLNATTPVELEQIQGFKLNSMGLVKLQGNQVTVSCKLYQQYFSDRFNN